MTDLFTYGTLMCDDILSFILGYLPQHKTGILKGHRRLAVRGENYPAIISDPTSAVNGRIYFNLTESDMKLLDNFEGQLYERRCVTVEFGDHTQLLAETYVARTEYKHCLKESDWDFDDFVKNHKSEYLI